jgi:hypothetical protein
VPVAGVKLNHYLCNQLIKQMLIDYLLGTVLRSGEQDKVPILIREMTNTKMCIRTSLYRYTSTSILSDSDKRYGGKQPRVEDGEKQEVIF